MTTIWTEKYFWRYLGVWLVIITGVCHDYYLISNHYHLLIETLDNNLSKGMRQLIGVFSQISNRRHGRSGHVFQGRYKAILVEKES